MTRLGTFCGRLLEAGWLAVLVATPLYFNVYTSRVFEPDKAALLRNLTLGLAVIWLVWWLESRASHAGPGLPLGKRLRIAMQANPLLLPAALYVGANVLATLFSVAPGVSFWGSYLRMQGLLSTLAYVVVFAVLVTHLRREEQAQRIGTVAILASVPVAVYGIVQRLKLDPLLWGTDVSVRVTSTLGNPIFLSAFLLIVTPLVVTRLFYAVAALRAAPARPLSVEGPQVARLTALLVAQTLCLLGLAKLTVPGTAHWWAYTPVLGLFLVLVPFIRAPQPGRLVVAAQVAGYSLVLLMHLVAAVFSQSRGPWLGLLAGLGLVVLLLAIRETPRVARAGLFATLVVGVLLLVGANVPGSPLAPLRQVPQVGRLADLSETQTGSGLVRLLVWQGAVELMTALPQAGSSPDGFRALRPIVGYGPESFYFTFTKVFPPDLWTWEGFSATPDRAHNEIIDQIAMHGILGLGTWLFTMHAALLLAVRLLGLLPPGRGWTLLVLVTGVVGLAVLVLNWLLRSERGGSSVPAERYALLAGLLAGLVGHFVEVQLGIAIVATRSYAWIIFGLLAALWLAEREQPADASESQPPVAAARGRRGPRPAAPQAPSGVGRPWWLIGAYVVVVLVLVMLLRQPFHSEIGGALLFLGQVLLFAAIGIVAIFLGPPVGPLTMSGRLWPAALAALCAVWLIAGNTTSVAADAVYKEAQAYADSRRPMEALPFLLRAAQMAPREDYYFLRLGGAYLEMAQGAPAGETTPPPFRTLDDLMAIDPARVRTFKREDHFRAAETILLHAQRMSPLNTDHYANLARLYLAWGVTSQPDRLGLSIVYFQRATQQSPAAPHLLTEMARAQYVAKDYEGAAASLAKAKEVMPGFNIGATLAGDIALGRGRAQEALDHYARAFASVPPPTALTDHTVDWRLENIVNAGLTEQAIARLTAARDNPDRGKGAAGAQAKAQSDYALNVALGFLYYRTKRLPEAAAAFDAATQAQPDQWLVQRNLGLVYFELGQRERAAAAFQQALRRAPQSEAAGLQQLVAQAQRP